MKGEILIYQSEDQNTQVEVRLKDESIWVNQYQMEELFQTDRTSIVKHLKNIFSTGELDEKSTCAKIPQVQYEGKREITRKIKYYNLDVIISVGYRINSKRGTQFRIWANNVLKDYLLKGYALNQNILNKEHKKLIQLNEVIKMISRLSLNNAIKTKSKTGFLEILDKYSSALAILDNYDNQRIQLLENNKEKAYLLEYDEIISLISEMKNRFESSELFGREKDESLKSSISSIYQTFAGLDLYPSIIDKATNLLYFLVKNHSFIDGNKRIAAAIFIYFLEKCNRLLTTNIDNNLLATLTLLIANSKPQERELILNIVSIILTNKFE
jgi:prophage maintenance system killer protein